jgi:hypothetical protein
LQYLVVIFFYVVPWLEVAFSARFKVVSCWRPFVGIAPLAPDIARIEGSEINV